VEPAGGGVASIEDGTWPRKVVIDLVPLAKSVPAILSSPSPTATRILETALDCFYGKGYEATSLQDIADIVGILKGSLYHYIESKQDLLAAVFVTQYERQRTTVMILNDEDNGGVDAIHSFVVAFAKCNLIDVRTTSIMDRDWRSLSQVDRVSVLGQTQRYLDYLREVITVAQSRGEISQAQSPGLAATGILGMLTWAHSWYRPGGRLTPDAVGLAYANLVVAGLQERP